MRYFSDRSRHEPQLTVVKNDVVLHKALHVVVRHYGDVLVGEAEFAHGLIPFCVLGSAPRHIGSFLSGEMAGRLILMHHLRKINGAAESRPAPPFAVIEERTMGTCHEIAGFSHRIIIANGREKENIPDEGMPYFFFKPAKYNAAFLLS